MPPTHRMPLRGRGEQLAAANAVLESAGGNGQAGALIVRGAAGAGKTRIVQAVSEMAEARGFQVLHGRGDVDAASMPMAPLLQAVLGGSPPLMDRAAVHMALHNDEARYVLVEVIIEALEQAARRRPLLVALDDVQFSDPTTLFAVRVASERLISEPVIWLIATREPIREDAVARTIDQLEHLKAATLLVPALSFEHATQVAEDLLAASLDDNLRRIVDRTEGQALDLVETLRGLIDEQRIEIVDGRATLSDTSVPSRLRDSVERRLARLPRPASTIVAAASVAGRSIHAPVVAALTGTSTDEARAALRSAELAQLVVRTDEGYGFRHDLIREAIELTLPQETRRELRRAAVTIQLEAGVPPLEVAAAVAATAQAGDDYAAQMLERASGDSAGVDPSTAADLVGRAAEIIVGDLPRRGRLLAQQVSLLWQAGRVDAAQKIGERALLAGLGPTQEAEVRLGLAQVASVHCYPEARRHTSTALALPGLADHLRAKLLAAHCLTKVMVGDFADLDDDLTAALGLARAVGDRASEVSLLTSRSCHSFWTWNWDDAFDKAQLAHRNAENVGAETSIFSPKALWLAFMSGAAGSPGTCLRLADQGIAEANAAGQGAAMSLWMMIRSRALLEAGRLSDAQTEAETVLAMTDWRERGTMADYTVNFVLRRVAQYTGDPAALSRTRAGAAAMARNEASAVRRQGKWLAAIDADADGHPDVAIELTSEGVNAYGQPGYAFSGDPADEPMFARIARRAGRPDLADRAARFTEQRECANPRYPLLSAIARHTRGLVDDDPDVLTHAAELFIDSHRPLAQAAALEDAGRVMPDRGSAVQLLDQAHDIYAKAGALRDAARTRQRLRALGARRRQVRQGVANSLAGLTPSELAVVELVARGATNREVAAQLFLSPHTVSTHLRHAFIKVGVRSRVELTRLTTLSESHGSQ